MPKEFPRTYRVGEQVQRELAELIRLELKDPRIGLVTVNGVEVSRDLAHAKVFVSMLDDAHDPEETVAALNKAAGFLRRQLGRRMHIRVVPKLRFHYDESVERGIRLTALIDRALEEDEKKRR